jgi:Heme/copper-type cytochrome/quinol oxidases, subunit 1
MGMTRRMQHYDIPEWHPWLLVAAAGAAVILAGIGLQIAQLVVSFRHREQLRDTTGDPWNGRSLEWSTSSPPPAFNFAVLPRIEESDAYWETKQRALRQHVLADEPAYADIELPRNSATGVVCAFFATFLGFALIWHIWWLAAVSFLGASRLSSPSRGATGPNIAFRPTRSPASIGKTAAPAARRSLSWGPPNEHRTRSREGRRPVHYWCRPPVECGPAEIRARGAHACLEARHLGLRLLDLPAQRHHHVLHVLCRLRGSVRADRRRPEREGPVDITRVAIETACLLLSSFACGVASIGARARNDPCITAA